MLDKTKGLPNGDHKSINIGLIVSMMAAAGVFAPLEDDQQRGLGEGSDHAARSKVMPVLAVDLTSDALGYTEMLRLYDNDAGKLDELKSSFKENTEENPTNLSELISKYEQVCTAATEVASAQGYLDLFQSYVSSFELAIRNLVDGQKNFDVYTAYLVTTSKLTRFAENAINLSNFFAYVGLELLPQTFLGMNLLNQAIKSEIQSDVDCGELLKRVTLLTQADAVMGQLRVRNANTPDNILRLLLVKGSDELQRAIDHLSDQLGIDFLDSGALNRVSNEIAPQPAVRVPSRVGSNGATAGQDDGYESEGSDAHVPMQSGQRARSTTPKPLPHVLQARHVLPAQDAPLAFFRPLGRGRSPAQQDSLQSKQDYRQNRTASEGSESQIGMSHRGREPLGVPAALDSQGSIELVAEDPEIASVRNTPAAGSTPGLSASAAADESPVHPQRRAPGSSSSSEAGTDGGTSSAGIDAPKRDMDEIIGTANKKGGGETASHASNPVETQPGFVVEGKRVSGLATNVGAHLGTEQHNPAQTGMLHAIFRKLVEQTGVTAEGKQNYIHYMKEAVEQLESRDEIESVELTNKQCELLNRLGLLSDAQGFEIRSLMPELVGAQPAAPSAVRSFIGPRREEVAISMDHDDETNPPKAPESAAKKFTLGSETKADDSAGIFSNFVNNIGADKVCVAIDKAIPLVIKADAEELQGIKALLNNLKEGLRMPLDELPPVERLNQLLALIQGNLDPDKADQKVPTGPEASDGLDDWYGDTKSIAEGVDASPRNTGPNLGEQVVIGALSDVESQTGQKPAQAALVDEVPEAGQPQGDGLGYGPSSPMTPNRVGSRAGSTVTPPRPARGGADMATEQPTGPAKQSAGVSLWASLRARIGEAVDKARNASIDSYRQAVPPLTEKALNPLGLADATPEDDAKSDGGDTDFSFTSGSDSAPNSPRESIADAEEPAPELAEEPVAPAAEPAAPAGKNALGDFRSMPGEAWARLYARFQQPAAPVAPAAEEPAAEQAGDVKGYLGYVYESAANSLAADVVQPAAPAGKNALGDFRSMPGEAWARLYARFQQPAAPVAPAAEEPAEEPAAPAGKDALGDFRSMPAADWANLHQRFQQPVAPAAPLAPAEEPAAPAGKNALGDFRSMPGEAWARLYARFQQPAAPVAPAAEEPAEAQIPSVVSAEDESEPNLRGLFDDLDLDTPKPGDTPEPAAESEAGSEPAAESEAGSEPAAEEPAPVAEEPVAEPLPPPAPQRKAQTWIGVTKERNSEPTPMDEHRQQIERENEVRRGSSKPSSSQGDKTPKDTPGATSSGLPRTDSGKLDSDDVPIMDQQLVKLIKVISRSQKNPDQPADARDAFANNPKVDAEIEALRAQVPTEPSELKDRIRSLYEEAKDSQYGYSKDKEAEKIARSEAKVSEILDGLEGASIDDLAKEYSKALDVVKSIRLYQSGRQLQGAYRAFKESLHSGKVTDAFLQKNGLLEEELVARPKGRRQFNPPILETGLQSPVDVIEGKKPSKGMRISFKERK